MKHGKHTAPIHNIDIKIRFRCHDLGMDIVHATCYLYLLGHMSVLV